MTSTLNSYQTDSTIRPQDDFYHYANKSWLDAHPIPDSESRWGTFVELRDHTWRRMRQIYEELQKTQSKLDSIQQQLSDFYYSGMHYDELSEKHLAYVDSLFGQIDAIDSNDKLPVLIGKLHALGIEGPWGTFVDADNLDNTRHVIRLYQAGLTLPDRDYYLEEDAKMRDVRVKFKEHIKAVYGYFPRLASDLDELWESVYSFEYDLAEKSRSSAELRDVEANYNRRSPEELEKEYPAFRWSEYAEALGWRMTQLTSVDQPEFFAYVNRQITDLPLPRWKAYLKWRVVMECYGMVNSELSQVKFDFFGRVLSGTSEIMPLWKRVILTIDDAMGEAAGHLYVERHFPDSSKRQVLDLVEKVRVVYDDRIARLDWMSDATKLYAQKKLANIKVLIGYPNQWRDFSGLKISRDSYLENSVRAAAFEKAYWLSRLHRPTSREDWFMDPHTVNAYNDPNRLAICFPAAILQPPFFDPNASLAANMGGIGAVIGHEFTHGFDDQGCMFDADGNVRTWQNDDERQAFKERARVIIDQADRFEILPGLTLKGGLIIGESIADLGGMEIAFEALENELGPEGLGQKIDGDLTAAQVFYTNYARCECTHVREEKLREFTVSDPHPASLFRVNGMVCHDDGFYRAFNVKPGDGLYLDAAKRARIW